MRPMVTSTGLAVHVNRFGKFLGPKGHVETSGIHPLIVLTPVNPKVTLLALEQFSSLLCRYIGFVIPLGRGGAYNHSISIRLSAEEGFVLWPA